MHVRPIPGWRMCGPLPKSTSRGRPRAGTADSRVDERPPCGVAAGPTGARIRFSRAPQLAEPCQISSTRSPPGSVHIICLRGPPASNSGANSICTPGYLRRRWWSWVSRTGHAVAAVRDRKLIAARCSVFTAGRARLQLGARALPQPRELVEKGIDVDTLAVVQDLVAWQF